MGFFSDLKQDLSQAVDEMASGEGVKDDSEIKTVQGEEIQENRTADDNESVAADVSTVKEGSGIDDVDLAAMLDKVAANGMEIDNASKEATEETGTDIPQDIFDRIDSGTEIPDASGDAENDGTVVQENGQDADEVADDGTEETVDTAETDAAGYDTDMPDELVSDAAEETEDEVSPVGKASTYSTDSNKYYTEKGNNEMDENEKMTPADETASVTAGMTINGDVKSAGSLDMIGTVVGNIDILGKLNITGTINGDSKATEIYAENAKITGELRSKGSVKIGQSTVIIGNVFATSAVIAGAVKGDIDVQGPVILDTSAIVMGNIKSKSVQINNGAVIEGMCSQCYADVNPSSFFEEFKKQK